MFADREFEFKLELVCSAALGGHSRHHFAVDNHIEDSRREIIIALGMLEAQLEHAGLTFFHSNCLLDARVLICCQFQNAISRKSEIRVRVEPFLNFDLTEDWRPTFNFVEEAEANTVLVERDRVEFEVTIED